MEFLAHQPPPHDLLRAYNRNEPFSTQPPEIPQTFLDAMSVRETVFVREQHVPLENEYDVDDPRSFHWVTYASVATTGGPTAVSRGFDVSSSGGNKGGAGNSKEDRRRSTATASKLPVGTIRLVPPPHPPHPTPSSSHQIDNSESTPAAITGPTSPTSPSLAPHGKPHEHTHTHTVPGVGTISASEPYVKLGRLAILPAYRRLGLGKLLVEAACEWAGKHAEDVVPKIEATERERERAHARGRSEDSGDGTGGGAAGNNGNEGGDLLGEAGGGKGDAMGAAILEPWKGLVLVHAQKITERTYAKWGFVMDEALGTWWEEGIEHVGMWRRVPVKAER